MSKVGKMDWERLRSYSTEPWRDLEAELEGAISGEAHDRKRRRQEAIARSQKKAKRKRRRQDRGTR